MERATNQKLMNMIGKMQPIEFIGLAKLLSVPVVKKIEQTEEITTTVEDNTQTAAGPSKNYEPRDFIDVLGDIMQRFNALNRTRKREILKLIQKSNNSRRK